MTRFFGRFALFLAALTTGSLLITGPPTPSTPLHEQLEFFGEHRNDYDVLFVGSSRVMRGVIPRVFDRRMAARGHPSRSFNFSAIGLRPHEANVFLQRLLEFRPQRLRWVVVELSEWTPEIRPANRFGDRSIFWHDARETLAAVQSSMDFAGPADVRFELSFMHLLHFGARTFGVGRGSQRVKRLLQRDKPDRSHPAVLTRDRGYRAYRDSDYRSGRTGPNRKAFMASVREYEAGVARLSAAGAAQSVLSASSVAALERQVDAIRAAGYEPVFVVFPAIVSTPQRIDPDREGRIAKILMFNNPAAHPELFAVENRFDANHLNTAGATRFTALLADAFADRVIGP